MELDKTSDHSKIYFLALNLIPNVGPVLFKNLVSYCGGIQQVFEASARDLAKIPSIGSVLSKQIVHSEVLEDAQAEYEKCIKEGVHIITYLSDNYPQRLTYYRDSPPVLYVKGNVNTNALRTVAIVGTRSASRYGKEVTEKIVEQLAPFDIEVISGMAYGIDITAHKKCVQLNIPTIGILGHGVESIYPSDHSRIGKDMMDNGGLISEFPIGSKPDREHFPMRNRIIAGMSDSIIVIESKERGGSMITAELAVGYHKDVFAVPGRIGDKRSAGCLELIKSNKAALIESGQDVAKAMMWDEQEKNRHIQRSLFVSMTEPERNIVELLEEEGSMHIDKIVHSLHQTGGSIAGTLLQLELKGMISVLPGKQYRLSR